MRFRTTLLLMLLLPLTLFHVSSPEIQKASAWGNATHRRLAEETIQELPADWYEVFDYYLLELQSGSVYPDVVLQDWDNHLYYPETGEHNAPWAINETFYNAIATFQSGNVSGGIFELGWAGHYLEDINIPVHTDEYWDGHAYYEDDINAHLDDFSYVANSSEIGIVTNWTDYAIQRAVQAHVYYDTLRAAYDPAEQLLDTDVEIQELTQIQLTRALTSMTCMLLTAIEILGDAPELPNQGEQDGMVLIDMGHNNDYSDSDLSLLCSELAKQGYNATNTTEPISAALLDSVDLLILTAPKTDLTNSELDAISTWFESGEKNLILTSRGDFSDYQLDSLDSILNTLGSVIRVNDDNAYTTDPDAYQTWYTTPSPVGPAETTLNITQGVETLSFFSPSSLYVTDWEASTWFDLVVGSPDMYQVDSNSPAPNVWYDNSQDDTGGDAILLGALEMLGDDDIAVFGTTFFSDFDFTRVEDDNIDLLYNLIEFMLSSYDGDPPTNNWELTTVSGSGASSTDDNSSDSDEKDNDGIPFLVPTMLIGLIAAVIITRRRSKNQTSST